MPTTTSSLEWFAIRVKSNREHITSVGLAGRGYEVFLPRHSSHRGASSSGERAPLLPGYLFCRFDAANRLPVLTLPGVVHIVGFGKTPVAVDDHEIESLKLLVKTGLPVTTDDVYTVGQAIRVVHGPLAGAHGIVAASAGSKDARLVVSITLLRRSVSVVLKPDWLVTGDGPDHPLNDRHPVDLPRPNGSQTTERRFLQRSGAR